MGAKCPDAALRHAAHEPRGAARGRGHRQGRGRAEGLGNPRRRDLLRPVGLAAGRWRRRPGCGGGRVGQGAHLGHDSRWVRGAWVPRARRHAASFAECRALVGQWQEKTQRERVGRRLHGVCRRARLAGRRGLAGRRRAADRNRVAAAGAPRGRARLPRRGRRGHLGGDPLGLAAADSQVQPRSRSEPQPADGALWAGLRPTHRFPDRRRWFCHRRAERAARLAARRPGLGGPGSRAGRRGRGAPLGARFAGGRSGGAGRLRANPDGAHAATGRGGARRGLGHATARVPGGGGQAPRAGAARRALRDLAPGRAVRCRAAGPHR